MKGMMYNVVYPCLLSLYIHKLRMVGGIVTPPRVNGDTRSQQCPRAIRKLESVSWPPKGRCDYISQQLVLLVVQHHGVKCVH